MPATSDAMLESFPTSALASSFVAAALLATPSCGHEAWLGMQCPVSDMRCDDAGFAAVGGAPDAGLGSEPRATMAALDAAVRAAESGVGAEVRDARAPAPPDARPLDAAALPSMCRPVTMGFFACATGEELPGAPRLQGGRAYTLRFQGAYAVDTTFQVQGATAACSPVMFGNLTLLAGVPAAQRCITPSEDIALLVTVMSGDVQVWMQDGLKAEICEGCE